MGFYRNSNNTGFRLLAFLFSNFLITHLWPPQELIQVLCLILLMLMSTTFIRCNTEVTRICEQHKVTVSHQLVCTNWSHELRVQNPVHTFLINTLT